MSSIRILAAGAIAALCAQSAQAVIVFDNGAPNSSNAYHSDTDTSNPSDTVIVGDDFSFGSSTAFNEVSFWGLYAFDNGAPAADDFTIAIYDYSGAVPSSSPLHSFSIGNAVSRTDTGADLFGFDVYSYSAIIPMTSLSGDFLLSVYNNTAGTNADWYWSCANEGSGNAWEQDAIGGDWRQGGGDSTPLNEYAFNLKVPAPSSLSLLAFGILLRNRRR